MIRTGLGTFAKALVPAAALLLVGLVGAKAAAVSPLATLAKPAAAIGSNGVVPVEMGTLERRHGHGMSAGAAPRMRGHRARGPRARSHRRSGRRHYRRHRRGSGVGIFLGLAPGYYYGAAPRRHYRGRCDYWARRCAANWGWNNNNFYGCMRYHGC